MAVAQNTLLSADLGVARATLVRLEKDLLSSHGLSTQLAAERNEARGQLEVARREKAAELESALARREAEHNTAMGEEVGRLAAEYKAQLPGIWDRAWELGWKAALKKAGVLGNSPIFRNPPNFPRSDSELQAISSPLPGPSSQACPEVSAASEVPPKAPPIASAVSEAPPAPEVVLAPLEASAVISEATTPAAPEASTVATEAPPEIDCNVEAAAP